jgi:glutaconate CoA-transferase subunit A
VNLVALDQAIEPIGDGMLLAIPPDYGGVAMAATRLLIQRGARNLRLVALPQSGLQADLLIGAGLAVEIETAAVTLGEAGVGPRFAAALGAGALRIKDATCPALHAGFQAAEKGVPFMPLRGIIGSDLLKVRPDWRVIDNPFEPGDPIVLVPAIRPDVALFHAPMADAQGNVWIGRRRELVSLAHAAAETLVTVDRLYDGNMLEDETLAAGVLPALYIARIALAPGGTWPLQSSTTATDIAHLADYARLARTDSGFATYLDRFLRAPQAA